jgi:hypothetical protein
VAEGARLESVYTGNRIVGSNPTPSAKLTAAQTLRLTSEGRMPNFRRNIVLKCDELLKQTR